jgi:hypothetical protein
VFFRFAPDFLQNAFQPGRSGPPPRLPAFMGNPMNLNQDGTVGKTMMVPIEKYFQTRKPGVTACPSTSSEKAGGF